MSNPIGKAKSVVMTEEGFLRAKELFKRFFTKETVSMPITKLTPEK